MNKISVIYWSQTGNTEAMAKAIGKGVILAGTEVEVVEVDNALLEELKEESVFALGCPAMGAEELEESVMEPFVSEVLKFVQGKSVALFGSYGWGDGEWMRNWVEQLKKAGVNVLNGEGLICQEAPDDDMLQQCENLGKQLVTVR